MKPSSPMPFWHHLEELRRRFFRTAVIYLILFSVCAYYSTEIFTLMRSPLIKNLPNDSFFIATSPLSGWLVFIKVALLAAAILVAPFLLFEILAFASPGLKTGEKSRIVPISILMGVFFYGGLAFAHLVVLPISLEFLGSIYQGSDVRFLPNIEDYFTFAAATLFGFGALFLLPFLVAFLVAAGLVSPAAFKKARSFIYLGAFIVGAILTPPDVASQLLMAIPFIFLFEIGLLLGRCLRPSQRL